MFLFFCFKKQKKRKKKKKLPLIRVAPQSFMKLYVKSYCIKIYKNIRFIRENKIFMLPPFFFILN